MRGGKSGQVLVRTQKANTPARRGWNADRAQPFLVIAAREASSISDDRQKKRTGFGPHPESEHPGQTRLECRSRTAISCDSHERREQHFRRPAEKADRFWSAPAEANTPARCGWNADRAQPFLVIATRDASSISDDRQKKRTGFGPHPRRRTPRPDAAGMPIAHSHFL